jgi:ribosomal protein S18 acetylase RimI-like enzyme
VTTPATIRPVEPRDLEWVREELTRHWGRPQIWSIGRMFQADALPGFIAENEHGLPVGLVTYSMSQHVQPDECEIVTLSSRAERGGVGGALLDAAIGAAQAGGRTRVFLTTTNDNLVALGFYQRRGWVLVRLHAGIIVWARERYPGIPRIGLNGIPLRDEIELEYRPEEARR